MGTSQRKQVPRPLDFEGIIGLWPAMRAFCEETGTPDATARAWIRRDRIPVEHWDQIIRAAAARQIILSLDTLMGAVRIAMAREGSKTKHRRTTTAATSRRAMVT